MAYAQNSLQSVALPLTTHLSGQAMAGVCACERLVDAIDHSGSGYRHKLWQWLQTQTGQSVAMS